MLKFDVLFVVLQYGVLQGDIPYVRTSDRSTLSCSVLSFIPCFIIYGSSQSSLICSRSYNPYNTIYIFKLERHRLSFLPVSLDPRGGLFYLLMSIYMKILRSVRFFAISFSILILSSKIYVLKNRTVRWYDKVYSAGL
jgi:hypothetical protein